MLCIPFLSKMNPMRNFVIYRHIKPCSLVLRLQSFSNTFPKPTACRDKRETGGWKIHCSTAMGNYVFSRDHVEKQTNWDRCGGPSIRLNPALLCCINISSVKAACPVSLW